MGDQSGNGYTGTYTTSGITYEQIGAIANESDSALLFDGSSGFATSPLSLNGVAAMSVECWVKFSVAPTTFPRFVASDFVNANHVGFQLGAGNPPGAFFNIGNGTTFVTTSFSTTMATNTWHHLVGTWDGTTMSIYWNGVLQQQNTVSAMGATSQLITLAGSRSAAQFAGSLDEVALYSTALSAARVLAHYQAGSTILTPAYTYGVTVLDDDTHYFLLAKNFDLIGNIPALHKVGRIEGMVKSGSFQGERILPVIVRIYGTSRADLEARLDVFYEGLALMQQPLAIHARDGRYFVADTENITTVFSSVTNSEFPGSGILWADLTIKFVCVNPYALAPVQSVYDTGTIALTQNGAVFSSAPIVFQGGGNVAALPQLRLYTQSISGGSPAISSLAVAQTTDSQTLTIGGAIMPTSAGDYLDIYCDPAATLGFQIIKNNLTLLTAIPTGVFPVQKPGSTSWVISYTTSGVTALSIRAVWTWTPLWLS